MIFYSRREVEFDPSFQAFGRIGWNFRRWDSVGISTSVVGILLGFCWCMLEYVGIFTLTTTNHLGFELLNTNHKGFQVFELEIDRNVGFL